MRLIDIIWQPRSIPKPWIIIGYTRTRVPWHMHRWNKWWRPIRWPLMLFWSWWRRIPFLFAFQLIAFFLFRHLLVFIQKLLKGRLGPIFCTARLPRFRSVRPVWQTGQTGPSEPIWLLLSCPPAELEHCSTILFESWTSLGIILPIELSDSTGFSLSSVKLEFLFNPPSLLTH